MKVRALWQESFREKKKLSLAINWVSVGKRSFFGLKQFMQFRGNASKCQRCRKQPVKTTALTAATTQQHHQKTGQEEDCQLRIKRPAQQKATIEESTLSNCCVPKVPDWGINYQKMKSNPDIFSTIQIHRVSTAVIIYARKGIISNRRWNVTTSESTKCYFWWENLHFPLTITLSE